MPSDNDATKPPKKAHGGARPGAGRPRNAPELVEIPAAPTGATLQAEASLFLRNVMNSNEIDMRLRIDAAKALMRHATAAPLGVRASAQEAAEAAAHGRFGVRPPPGGIKAARHAAAFDPSGTAWDDLLPGPDDTKQ